MRAAQPFPTLLHLAEVSLACGHSQWKWTQIDNCIMWWFLKLVDPFGGILKGKQPETHRLKGSLRLRTAHVFQARAEAHKQPERCKASNSGQQLPDDGFKAQNSKCVFVPT